MGKKRGRARKVTLDEIIENCTKQEVIEELTDEQIRQFKYCLSLVDCEAKLIGTTLYTRPRDIPRFRYTVHQNGLGNNQTISNIVAFMESKFIRFVH